MTSLVFFNASVILAGFKSKKGASASLVSQAEKGKIRGIISEIVVDEVSRHLKKMELDEILVDKKIHKIFKIVKAPDVTLVDRFKKIVIDLGDAHILASASESKSKFLVTLDRKHLLILKNKMKQYQIISPGDLVNRVRNSNII